MCADPVGVNQAAKNLLLEQLTDGAVQILDIAAGHGAGTLSILSFIAAMREQSKLPKLPLNVAVTALDFSADALATYQQVAEELREWLAKQGITLSVDVSLPAGPDRSHARSIGTAARNRLQRSGLDLAACTGKLGRPM